MPPSLRVGCRSLRLCRQLRGPITCIAQMAPKIVADLWQPGNAAAAAAFPRARPAGPREAADPRQPAVDAGADPADVVFAISIMSVIGLHLRPASSTGKHELCTYRDNSRNGVRPHVRGLCREPSTRSCHQGIHCGDESVRAHVGRHAHQYGQALDRIVTHASASATLACRLCRRYCCIQGLRVHLDHRAYSTLDYALAYDPMTRGRCRRPGGRCRNDRAQQTLYYTLACDPLTYGRCHRRCRHPGGHCRCAPTSCGGRCRPPRRSRSVAPACRCEHICRDARLGWQHMSTVRTVCGASSLL